MVARPTRRTFLRQAGAGLLALPALGAVAGCGGGGDGGGELRERGGDGLVAAREDFPAGSGGDADLLNRALAIELTAVAAYTAGSPLLEGQSLAAGIHFLAQERAHAGRLRELIGGVGGTPVGARPSYDFGTPDSEAEVLRLLHRVEQETIALYGEIVPRLADPRLRAATATIAANEAQHDAILLQRLGRWPVPTAFVDGAR